MPGGLLRIFDRFEHNKQKKSNQKGFPHAKVPNSRLLPLFPDYSDTAIHQQYLKTTFSLPFIELLLTRQSKVTQIFNLADLYQGHNSTEASAKQCASKYHASLAGRWLKRGVNVA